MNDVAEVLMNDETKAAVKWLREATDAGEVEYVERGFNPVDKHLGALLIHIDGEPARQAAAVTEATDRAFDAGCRAAELEQAHVRLRAVAEAREEQREACARTVENGYRYMAGTHAAAVRATPLTAAPLKDRIASLERQFEEVCRAEAINVRQLGELFDANATVGAERDAALERVKELEAQVANLLEVNALVGQDCNLRADRAEAERDELRQRILDSCPSPDEGGRIHAGGRIVCGQCHDSEVSHLRAQLAEATERLAECSEANHAWRAQLAEAVETLRSAELEFTAVASWSDEAIEYNHPVRLRLRAFLAKHPEGL